MSTFKVTVEQLEIEEHPNADALELARVGGYRAVVAKDAYKTGDYAVYIPEQAVLPEGLIEELGLTGRLAGSKKNRVKAVRLRGELSQGIVCRPSILDNDDTFSYERLHDQGADLSEALGIEKYVPEVPVHMSGKVEPAPDLIRWPDVENIKRYPDIFEDGEMVIATEKIHGTCCLLTYDNTTNQCYVSSKGFGSRDLALVEDEKNVYWRAAHAYDLKFAARTLAEGLDVERIGLFGEVYGAGVQDLHYGVSKGVVAYSCFDVAYIDHDGRRVFVDAIDLRELLEEVKVPSPPVRYYGSYDERKLLEAAEGKSSLADHVNEGVVVRPTLERYSDILGGRAIAKFVSESYLTRKGGTEYE